MEQDEIKLKKKNIRIKLSQYKIDYDKKHTNYITINNTINNLYKTYYNYSRYEKNNINYLKYECNRRNLFFPKNKDDLIEDINFLQIYLTIDDDYYISNLTNDKTMFLDPQEIFEKALKLYYSIGDKLYELNILRNELKHLKRLMNMLVDEYKKNKK